MTVNQQRCQRASIRRAHEQAGTDFFPKGVCHCHPHPLDACALFADLHAISQLSAARLHSRALLTDADLYDEDGVPA